MPVVGAPVAPPVIIVRPSPLPKLDELPKPLPIADKQKLSRRNRTKNQIDDRAMGAPTDVIKWDKCAEVINKIIREVRIAEKQICIGRGTGVLTSDFTPKLRQQLKLFNQGRFCLQQDNIRKIQKPKSSTRVQGVGRNYPAVP